MTKLQTSPASKHTAPKWCQESAARIIDAIEQNEKLGLEPLNAEEFADLIEDEYSRAANNHERLVEALRMTLGALENLVKQLPTDERLSDFNLDYAEAASLQAEAALKSAQEGE